MKYIKITLGIFTLALIFSVFNINASTIRTVIVTIPAFSQPSTLTKEFKYTESYQYIKKTKCVDNSSGDGRVIIANLHLTTDNANPNYDPSPVEAAPNTNVRFDNYSKQMGSWNLSLRSNKWLLTTASFEGQWTVDE